jgi:hypothetical protein
MLPSAAIQNSSMSNHHLSSQISAGFSRTAAGNNIPSQRQNQQASPQQQQQQQQQRPSHMNELTRNSEERIPIQKFMEKRVEEFVRLTSKYFQLKHETVNVLFPILLF